MRVAWFALLPGLGLAQRLGCTCLAIDGAASVGGAGFAVENTDGNNADFRLNFVPPSTHTAGALRPVYLNPVEYPRFVGYNRGEIYHPKEGQNVSKPVGYIPEISSTYGYYESIAPLMNDQGLGIAESSCTAYLQNNQPDSPDAVPGAPIGILDAITIMQLPLERCATASCAVDVMGELAETYGYLPFAGEPTFGLLDGKPFWADSGEGYSVADAQGNAWVLHMLGGVKGLTKSVWAAQKVKKGHFAIVANEFTMGELPLEPNQEFRFTKNIRQAALKANLWDGKEPFHFTKVFAPDPTRYATGRAAPIPTYSSLRRWRHTNLVAPSLDVKFDIDHRNYPFSVKAERKLSHRDVMNLMKDHYGGTEFDLTQGVLAGPYGTPFRVEGGPWYGQVPRGFSILRTVYSTISQTGPEGSTLWFAANTPKTSVYVPLDARSAGGVSTTYGLGSHREFDRDAAWWGFGFVKNWMLSNYKGMSEEDVYPRIEAWQDRIDRELLTLKAKSNSELGQWQIRLQEEIAKDWRELSDFLVMKWNDMSRTSENVTAQVVGYPDAWAKMIGFSNDIHPVWVKPSDRPETLGPDFVAPTTSLPRTWDNSGPKCPRWTDWSHASGASETSLSTAPSASAMSQFACGAGLLVAGIVVGFATGRRYPSRDLKHDVLLG